MRSPSRVLLLCAVSLLLQACGDTASSVPMEEVGATPAETLTARTSAMYEQCPVYADGSDPTYSECEVCGNGVCDMNETSDSCPQDCSFCGDGMCNGWESSASCPGDCGVVCGDGTCNGGETVSSCLADCGPKLRSVLLDRVRRCRNDAPWPCNSTLTRSEYHWWEHFGVANDKQKRTYLAQPLNPGRDNVRHLVFIAAGQQDGDMASGVTGQQDGFKGPFDETDGSEWVGVSSASLASRLVEELYRSPNDTFMGLAFDARFNYGFSPSNKQDIENAYYEWLKEKFYSWNLRSVYLAGHSRGGCLAARLGRRFKQEFPSTPVIVHIFDGVCHINDGEFGVQPWAYYNPVANHSEFYAFSSDIGAQFPTTYNLAVHNMVSGDQVLTDFADSFVGVHAFGSHVSTAASSSYFTVGDWYTQAWYSYSHMGMAHYTVSDALWHYRQSCNRFGC